MGSERWRKKPVVIEAWQVPWDNLADVAQWCEGEVSAVVDLHGPGERWITIHTLEGEMRAEVGDWIIKGVEGEFYPCKPNIFAATYEREPS